MRNDTSNPNECKITSWPGGWLTAHRHRRTAAVLTSSTNREREARDGRHRGTSDHHR
jgi:hypothetical protein